MTCTLSVRQSLAKNYFIAVNSLCVDSFAERCELQCLPYMTIFCLKTQQVSYSKNTEFDNVDNKTLKMWLQGV